MTEAVRDVVLRVSLRPGEQMGLPDWVKANGGAAQYFRGVEEGYRKLAQESAQATAKLKEQQVATEGVTEAASKGANDSATEMSRLTVGIEKAIDAFDGIAQSADSLKDVKLAVEAYASEIQAALNLDPEQTAQVTKALLEEGERLFTESQQRIGRSEQEAGTKRIAEWERLREAQKKAALQFQNLWMESFQKITLAGTHFASVIQQSKLLGNEKQNIEELARTFVEVSASIQMIHHGSEGLKQLSRAMTELQKAAQVAQTSLAATGASATFAQSAMIRLAPAAAAAHAALGPISLILGAISVAAIGVQAATSFFGDKLPDDIKEAERALEAYNNQLRDTHIELSMVAAQLEAQTNAMRTQFDIQKQMQGGDVTRQQIETNFTERLQQTSREGRNRIRAAGAEAEATLTPEQREALQAQERAARTQRAIVTKMEALPRGDRRRISIGTEKAVADTLELRLNQTREKFGLNTLDQIRSSGETDPLKLAKAIETLPPAMQAAFRDALAENLKEELALRSEAQRESEQQAKSRETGMTDFDRKILDAERAFQDEKNRALELRALQEDGKMGDLMGQLQFGSPLKGLEALSPFLSSDRQQVLRNSAADNTLSVQDLIAELADAQEFETEKQQLDQQLETLRAQHDALEEQRATLVEFSQRLLAQMKETNDTLAKVVQSAR